MKSIFKSAGICLLFVVSLTFGSEAKAIAPTLALANANDGDAIQVTVHGDANFSVLFGYTKVDGTQYLASLGKTDASGNFSAPISTSLYGIMPSSIVRVTVNAQRSNELLWPVIAPGSQLLLSETGVAMPLGQARTITAIGNGTNLLYLSNNSNPPVANVSIAGNQISIQPVNIGATVITVCANIANPICASAYVSVQTTDIKPLVFSQGNVSIASGQTLAISIVGGSGNYTVANNSNPKAITGSVDGLIVNVKALSNSGYSALTICSSDLKVCGVINATAADVTSSGLTFSQTNPTIQVGQTLSIGINGGVAGSYSIFANSNTNILIPTIVGSNLNLVGLAVGSATITVCSGGACGVVNAVVSYVETGGNIKLNQNNLWLNVGQSQNITISGGAMPYAVFNEATSTVKTSLEGNVLSLVGLNPGNTSLNVCSAKGGCTPLAVLINSISNVTPGKTVGFTLTPNNTTLFVGNTQAVSISVSGTYVISGNSHPAVASVEIAGSNLIISALAQGSTDVYVCQSGGQCASVSVSVIMSGKDEPATIPSEMKGTSTTRVEKVEAPKEIKAIEIKFKFKRPLQAGVILNDVKELQKKLAAEKLYIGKITGKFDYLTKKAVQKYQKIKNIRPTGNVGPQTMSILNK